MLPVDYAEPDITCVAKGIKFGIAAKRLKSIEQFDERIKEGAGQLRRANLPGIVAIELTLAHNPSNSPVTSGLHSQMLLNIRRQRTWQLFKDLKNEILRLVDDSRTLAVLSIEFSLRVTPDYKGWIHEGLSTWFETTRGLEPATNELAVFQQRFLSGVPHLNNLE
jgi:hypothetical protein